MEYIKLGCMLIWVFDWAHLVWECLAPGLGTLFQQEAWMLYHPVEWHLGLCTLACCMGLQCLKKQIAPYTKALCANHSIENK